MRIGEGELLALPDAARTAVAGSRELLFGVRPEDMHLQAREHTAPIHGHVEIVEPLGAESLVHVRIGEELIIVRAEGRRTVESDKPITLHIDLQRIYLFDRDSERCLYHDTQGLS